MENPRAEETNLRVFNTAKVFSEQILFPLMFDFKKFQRQVDFGCEKLDDASNISEEVRDIQRVNGLKAMSETTYNLLNAIASTVKLKGNAEEVDQLKSLLKLTERIKQIFYENKEKFFVLSYKNTSVVETLDRDFFNKIRKIIDTCYINTEILMTRNKLLFADSNDEFKSDEELKQSIAREYIEG